MLYADDEAIVPKSGEGLDKRMTVIVTVFKGASLTVSEKKTETMLLRTPDHAALASSLVIKNVFIFGRRDPRKRRPPALNRTADPCYVGMRQNGSALSCMIWRSPRLA